MNFLTDRFVPMIGFESGLDIVNSLRHSFAVAALGESILVGIIVMLFAVRVVAKPHGGRRMREL